MTGFEDLRQQQGAAYRDGSYKQAIELGVQAYHLTDPNSLEAALVARDVAAACMQQGDKHSNGAWIGTCKSWLDTSLRILDGHYNPLWQREHAATLAMAGRGELKLAVEDEGRGKSGSPPSAFGNSALKYLRAAQTELIRVEGAVGNTPDPYRVHLLRRIGSAEALYGNRARAFKLGLMGVRFAAKAESPDNKFADHNLTKRERWMSKAKVLAGGVFVIGTSIFSSPQPSRRRKVALALSKHTT